MEWKQLPLLDQDLVKYLRKKYPPLEYQEDMTKEEFLRQAIFRAGQRDTANVIEHIINLQRKGD
jgi:hypothetical protein